MSWPSLFVPDQHLEHASHWQKTISHRSHTALGVHCPLLPKCQTKPCTGSQQANHDYPDELPMASTRMEAVGNIFETFESFAQRVPSHSTGARACGKFSSSRKDVSGLGTTRASFFC